MKDDKIPDDLFSLYQNGEQIINKLKTADADFLEILTKSLPYYANSLKQVIYRTPENYPDGKWFTDFFNKSGG